MDVDVRLLRSFVAIFELGSLSRAAVRLACTQAAMSLRLQRLEAEIGARLFVRGPRAVAATSHGNELYARALAVIAAYDELTSSARHRAPRPKLRIGAPDDYAFGLLPAALSRLRGAHPEFEYEIVCDLSAALAAATRRGDLDLALLTLAAEPEDCLRRFSAPLEWVLAPRLRLARDDAVPLAAYPEGCVFRRAMIDALEARDRSWRVAAQSRSHTGVMAAVRAGLAVTVAAVGTAPDDLMAKRSVRGLPPLAPAPVYLVRRPGETGAALRRVEALFVEGLTQPTQDGAAWLAA